MLAPVPRIEWKYLDGKLNGCEVSTPGAKTTFQAEEAEMIQAAVGHTVKETTKPAPAHVTKK